MNKKSLVSILLGFALLAIVYSLGRAQTAQPASVLVCAKKTDGTMVVIQNAADCKDRGTVLNIYTQSGVDTQLAATTTSVANLTSQLAAAQQAIAALTAQVNDQAAQIAALSTHEARLAVVEDKLYHFSRSGNEITIKGANLHIVNGATYTNYPNGLGNLIIGYNQERYSSTWCGGPTSVTCDNIRTGSHMLVLGDYNNYSGSGGLVSGTFNAVLADYSTVLAGTYNEVNAVNAADVSGIHNVVEGRWSSAIGGFRDTVTPDGDGSVIIGGVLNNSQAIYSSITGGKENSTHGAYSSISGGYQRSTTGENNWVAGELFQAQ